MSWLTHSFLFLAVFLFVVFFLLADQRVCSDAYMIMSDDGDGGEGRFQA